MSGPADMRRFRRGFTLLEVLVAAWIFSVVVAYAAGSYYFAARASKRSDRVDDYRQMRIVFNRVARDLEDASRLKLPAYGCFSYRLVMLDGVDRQVSYSVQDGAGSELAAQPADTDPTPRRIVRSTGAASEMKSEIIPQTDRILWMKFTRLGERLMGMTVRMKPREPGKPGALFTSTMTVNQVMP